MWERAPRPFRQAQRGGFFFHQTFLQEYIVKVRGRLREVFLQERLCKTLFCGSQAPCLHEVARRRLRPVEIVKFGSYFRSSRDDGNWSAELWRGFWDPLVSYPGALTAFTSGARRTSLQARVRRMPPVRVVSAII